MKQRFFRFCAILMMPFMLALNCPVAAIGANSEAPAIDIEITHDPVEKVTAGQRIMLEAEVEDESGVEVVRAYFKAVEAADYNFVVLDAVADETYKGTLPAPAIGADGVDYLILVKNGNNQVVKTQTYRIEVEDDENAPHSVANNGKINVYTELQQAPTEVTGFSDNIAIDVVESTAKLGVVAGIYSAAATGSSTSGAVSAGTVAASTGGISTTTIVIGAVVAVAAIGGIAASGSSGTGGAPVAPPATGSTTTPPPPPPPPECPYQGNFQGQWNWYCIGADFFGEPWGGAVDSNCNFSANFQANNGISGFELTLSGKVNASTGIANLNGQSRDCGAVTGTATFTGSDSNISVTGSFGSPSSDIGNFSTY